MKQIFSLILVLGVLSCGTDETIIPTDEEDGLVNVSLTGVGLTFTANNENNSVSVAEHVNYTGTRILRIENQDSVEHVNEHTLSYEELVNFNTQLPEGKYTFSLTVDAEHYSEFLPFRFAEENVNIEGNDAVVKVNPLTDYSLVQLDTAYLQVTDTIPFISSRDFGEQNLFLHPEGKNYYSYVTTGQGGLDIEVIFREKTYGDEKIRRAFITPRNSYAFGLSKEDGLPEGPSIDRFKKVTRGSRNPFVGYWEYLPVGYGYGKKWPIIFFFHGLGENGNGGEQDLGKLIVQGLPRIIGSNDWPVEGSSVGDEFIVLSMQNRTGCPSPSTVDDFIRWAAKEYEVDIQRIYLTGLSCGGIGIWNYVREHLDDDLVAAVVPIAGHGANTWSRHRCDLGKLPIWAFHGELDDVVGPEGTNIPMDGLAGCTDPAPVDARKTIYPGVRHLGWNITYDLSAGHDIYAWFLSHVNENASLD